MSKLKRICALAILTASLANSVLAGIMDSPGVAAPPPPPPPSETSTTSAKSISDSTTDIRTTIILTIVGLIPAP